jgi:protein-S-isoprenylcysteine O-methyltransferase Ste14
MVSVRVNSSHCIAKKSNNYFRVLLSSGQVSFPFTIRALALKEHNFMLKALGRKAALSAVYAERYVLSLVYLYFAWAEFHIVLYLTWNEFHILQLSWVEPLVTRGVVFAEVARHVISFLLNTFTGVLLLLGRRAAVLPQKLKDILVPLATSFFVLTYNAITWFPTSVQKSLCPHDWQIPLIFAGLLLGIIGLAVAIWGILYLGRSFGILVVVRKVVLGGPYQWVRHPMYLGYICMLAGLILVNFSVAYFILVPIHIALLLYRARLEEVRLSEYSAEYREYRKRAGFILPRLRRPAPASPEGA